MNSNNVKTELHVGEVTVVPKDGQRLTANDWEGAKQLESARQTLDQRIGSEENQRAQRLGLIAGLRRAMRLIATQYYAELARRNRKK